MLSLAENLFPPVGLEEIRQTIGKYRDGDSFLRLMSGHYGHSSTEFFLIKKAHTLVTKDFADKRRHSGEEYAEHLRAVAIIAFLYRGDKSHTTVIERLLHDWLEDIPESLHWTLYQMFGAVITHTVNGVTKPQFPPQPESMTDDEYELLKQKLTFTKVLLFGKRSRILKCDDRLHNMLTLWGDPESKKRKIVETIDFVLPISMITNGTLYLELTSATSEQLRRLHINDWDSHVPK